MKELAHLEKHLLTKQSIQKVRQRAENDGMGSICCLFSGEII